MWLYTLLKLKTQYVLASLVGKLICYLDNIEPLTGYINWIFKKAKINSWSHTNFAVYFEVRQMLTFAFIYFPRQKNF